MWVTQTVFVLALWCSLVSGYPTPTIPVHTKLPKREGCIYQGKWYRLNTEISKGGDGNGWSYGVYCNANGKPVMWDKFSTGTTTEPPTTTMPTTMMGCEFDGRRYAPGDKISEGEDRDSNWCYETWCGEEGEIIHADNFNCFPTSTSGPPTTTDDITDLPTTSDDIPIDNEDIVGHSDNEHRIIKRATEWAEGLEFSGDFTIPPAKGHEAIRKFPKTDIEGSSDFEDNTHPPTGIDEEITTSPTEHEGSTTDVEGSTNPTDDRIYTTNIPTSHAEETTTVDFKTTSRPTTEHEGSTYPTTNDEDITSDSSADSEDTTTEPTGDYEDTTIPPTSDYEDTTIPPTSDYEDTTTVRTYRIIYCFFLWTTPSTTTIGPSTPTWPEDSTTSTTSPEDSTTSTTSTTSPVDSTTSSEDGTTLPTIAEGCWFEGKRYTPGAIVRGSRGTLKWGIICLENGEIWHYDGYSTGSPSTTETKKGSIPGTTASSLIARRRVVIKG